MNAAQYDSWYDTPLGAACLAAEVALLRRGGGDLKGKVMLDVGCGTGRFLLALGQEAIRAVGIDRDVARLDFARSHTPAEMAQRVEWVEGDAAALPFPDETFDLVLENTLLCFCNNPASVIREMARVCHPGGRILLGELNPYSPWQWWRRLKAAFGFGSFVGAPWHQPRDLLAALAANGCQSRLLGRAIFWPLLNIADVLHWRSVIEWLGAKLWPFAGAYYVVIGKKRAAP
jgi:ubiquinone/menaquinone biosynthesis C-methylase UbiE